MRPRYWEDFKMILQLIPDSPTFTTLGLRGNTILWRWTSLLLNSYFFLILPISDYKIIYFHTLKIIKMRTQRIDYLYRLNIVLVSIFIFAYAGNACLSLHGEERDILDAREMLNTQQNIANCLRKSLQQGTIGLSRSIISVYGSQYQNLFQGIFEAELKRLKLMQQEIVLSESTCQPVVKWGQNETHIFVSMKMSHRWDSPPCLNTKNQLSQLKDNVFEYINVCVVSQSKITFKFSVNFYDNVKNEKISVHKDGVGIYSTIIEKDETKVWPFLSKEQKSYQIWGQISQRYNSVHHQYQSLVDGILRARRSKPVVFDENKVQTDSPSHEENKQEVVHVEDTLTQVETIETKIEDQANAESANVEAEVTN